MSDQLRNEALGTQDSEWAHDKQRRTIRALELLREKCGTEEALMSFAEFEKQLKVKPAEEPATAGQQPKLVEHASAKQGGKRKGGFMGKVFGGKK